MASVSDWKVPASAQPKSADYAYDLDLALSTGSRSVVSAVELGAKPKPELKAPAAPARVKAESSRF